jgi:hypothetical protein
MRAKALAAKPAERGRPLWGFCRIRVETICRLWAALRERDLSLCDLRVWFGAHELVTRRCTMGKGRRAAFTEQELGGVCELAAPRVRASIRLLERMGFLSWSQGGIVLKDGTPEGAAALTGLPAMLSSVTNHRRTVPIPRHTVLLLARTRRPVSMATVLGLLFRCMYYRSGECVSWGTCKASWVAETFGVDIRNVKAARRELERLGWMRQLDSFHWHRQRYGGSFVVTLAWDSRQSPSGPRKRQTISPPQRASSPAKSPPPESYRDLPSGIKDQKRAAARRAGVQGQPKGEGAPRLLHVVPMDLQSPGRTANLFHQALRAGLVRDAPTERLRFFAAAERANRLGSNPGGFFVTMLKKRLWQNISHGEEEAARQTLARMPEFFYGEKSQRRPAATPSAIPSSQKGSALNATPERAAIRELVRRSLASVVSA